MWSTHLESYEECEPEGGCERQVRDKQLADRIFQLNVSLCEFWRKK